MALLQNTKAIFYHPLDNATEALKSQAWVGTPAFIAGKIGSGVGAIAVGGVFGSETEFLSAVAATHISVTSLSATTFVVAYSDGPTGNHGVAKLGTISGGTIITFGTGTEFSATALTELNWVTTLTATSFVVVWHNGGVGSGEGKVGTVSGTDITFGAAATFTAASGHRFFTVTTMTATEVVVAYQDGVTGGKGTINVGTVSGTTVTWGAKQLFLSVLAWALHVEALTSTKFIVSYTDANSAFSGKIRIGLLSGGVATFGAAAEFVVVEPTLLRSAKLTSTKFIIGWNAGKCRIGSVSGLAVTYGSEIVFGTSGNLSAVALSSTRVTILWEAAGGSSKVGTVTGLDVTFGADTRFLIPASAPEIAASLLPGTNSYALAYKDTSDSSHGTAKIGVVSGGSDLVGSGAAYNSAATATKVAFVGWLKKPSSI